MMGDLDPADSRSCDAAFPVVGRATLSKRLGRRLVQVATALGAMPAQIGYWRLLRETRNAGVLADPFDLRKPWPVAAKHLGCYLSPSFSTCERIAILRRTYEVLAHRTRGLPHLDLPRRRRVWTCPDAELDLAVWIGPPTSTPMEGELAFVFTAQGATIYTLTLSIAPGRLVGVPDDEVILIGGLQGVVGARAAIRQAAKALGEVAPQDVLLLTARAFAQVLGVEGVVGIGSQLHVSHDAGDESGVDYDDLWTRKDAIRTSRGFFLLPPTGAVSSKGEQSSSAHRSRAKRKRALKGRLQSEIGSILRAFFAARQEPLQRCTVASGYDRRLRATRASE